MKFLEKLERRMDKTGSLVCVGIDPVLEMIPAQFSAQFRKANGSRKGSRDGSQNKPNNDDPLFEFGKWIVDQTHENVIAYKPNSAFYEANGEKGIRSLKKTCDYIKKNHPDIPIIIDAKRGDIGHTNAQYAKFIFEYLGADAVTLQPYLGSEALSEFFKYENKGLIILCRTSNPGAGEFQDLLVNMVNGGTNLEKTAVPLWQKVAVDVTTNWKKKSKADLLLVVGATYPDELKKVRELAPNTTFLIPGIGKQGGSLEKTLKYGPNKSGKGIIISSSRGIIYSENPKKAIKKLIKSIEKVAS